jgi:hypothetical protein
VDARPFSFLLRAFSHRHPTLHQQQQQQQQQQHVDNTNGFFIQQQQQQQQQELRLRDRYDD